jgi:hypothetical protein
MVGFVKLGTESWFTSVCRTPRVVIEDRGPIGVNGRRLLRVEVTVDEDAEPMSIEVPAEETRVIAA